MTLARLARSLARIPATICLLVAVTVSTAVVAGLPEGAARRVILSQSTNLHELGRHPLRVLVVSAFLIGEPVHLPLVVLAGLLLATVEWWLGTARWVGVFAAGHVGATLLTAAAIWVGLQLRVADPDLERATDVGVSYGFAALAAVLAFRLPRRWRALYAAALVGAAVAGVLVWGGFTDFGHLLAVGIGFAVQRAATRRAPRPEPTRP